MSDYDPFRSREQQAARRRRIFASEQEHRDGRTECGFCVVEDIDPDSQPSLALLSDVLDACDEADR